jgi:hypothetical protein
LVVRQSVYIETTIPSYYATDRSVLQQDAARTREWCLETPLIITPDMLRPVEDES